MKHTIRGAALAALALAAAAPLAAQMPQPEPAITVQGMGEVRVQTDRARVSFMVETQARTARAHGGDA